MSALLQDSAQSTILSSEASSGINQIVVTDLKTKTPIAQRNPQEMKLRLRPFCPQDLSVYVISTTTVQKGGDVNLDVLGYFNQRRDAMVYYMERVLLMFDENSIRSIETYEKQFGAIDFDMMDWMSGFKTMPEPELVKRYECVRDCMESEAKDLPYYTLSKCVRLK